MVNPDVYNIDNTTTCESPEKCLEKAQKTTTFWKPKEHKRKYKLRGEPVSTVSLQRGGNDSSPCLPSVTPLGTDNLFMIGDAFNKHDLRHIF